MTSDKVIIQTTFDADHDIRTSSAKFLGYGEDALTLRMLQKHINSILDSFQDESPPSSCVVFYRPSFGRHGTEGTATFGEFDAIVASSCNLYSIESKWDNLSKTKREELILDPEQEIRHKIFSWYILHWNRKYTSNWLSFSIENKEDFETSFPGRTLASPGSLLAKNLEFILERLSENRIRPWSREDIKNVLVFFFDGRKSKPPTKISKGFTLVGIDYSEELTGNFVRL